VLRSFQLLFYRTTDTDDLVEVLMMKKDTKINHYTTVYQN